MAMYLSGVPVYTIMLLGRWSNDAFLWYIRKQVKEFSKGVSKNMLTSKKFLTIPTISNNNPRLRNHASNITSRSNSGLCFKAASQSLVRVLS
jgi:hypothetical protein